MTPGQDGAASVAAPALRLPSLGERASLRTQVTEALRGAVITGDMQPGVLYSAPTLAAQFGVSATPVREAMLDLAKEGLIEAVRNKGFRVTELTDAELDEITEVRALLEAPAVQKVAGHCTADIAGQVEALRPIAREIVELARAGDLIPYVERDRVFHLRLLELAGNARLVKVVGGLRSASRLYGLRALVERGALQESAAEHEQILDLVLARRSEDVAALVRRHIAHVRGSWAGREEPDVRR